jgi:hypothetical protein
MKKKEINQIKTTIVVEFTFWDKIAILLGDTLEVTALTDIPANDVTNYSVQGTVEMKGRLSQIKNRILSNETTSTSKCN